jgi:hypothetical protein
MIKFLITEKQLDLLLEQSVGKVAFLKNKYPDISEEDIKNISDIDPTKNKEYLDFIINVNLKYPNINLESLRDSLSVYDTLKKENSIVFNPSLPHSEYRLDKNINNYINKINNLVSTIILLKSVYEEIIKVVNNSEKEYSYIIEGREKKKYVKWLFKKYMENVVKSEDFYKYSDYIYYFNVHKNDKNFKGPRDISGYDSLPHIVQSLKDFLPKENLDERYLIEDKSLIDKGEAELIANNSKVMIVSPLTLRASKFYGCNSEWCTLYSERFDYYTSNGVRLYIIINKNYLNRDDVNRRIQFNLSEDGIIEQMMDMNDEYLNNDEFGDTLMVLLKSDGNYFSKRIDPVIYIQKKIITNEEAYKAFFEYYKTNLIKKENFGYMMSAKIDDEEISNKIKDFLFHKGQETPEVIIDSVHYETFYNYMKLGKTRGALMSRIIKNDKIYKDVIENFIIGISNETKDKKDINYGFENLSLLYQTAINSKLFDEKEIADIEEVMLDGLFEGMSKFELHKLFHLLNADSLNSTIYNKFRNILEKKIFEMIEEKFHPKKPITYFFKGKTELLEKLKENNKEKIQMFFNENLNSILKEGVNDYGQINTLVSLKDLGLVDKIPSNQYLIDLFESFRNSEDPTVRRYYEYIKDMI